MRLAISTGVLLYGFVSRWFPDLTRFSTLSLVSSVRMSSCDYAFDQTVSFVIAPWKHPEASPLISCNNPIWMASLAFEINPRTFQSLFANDVIFASLWGYKDRRRTRLFRSMDEVEHKRKKMKRNIETDVTIIHGSDYSADIWRIWGRWQTLHLIGSPPRFLVQLAKFPWSAYILAIRPETSQLHVSGFHNRLPHTFRVYRTVCCRLQRTGSLDYSK